MHQKKKYNNGSSRGGTPGTSTVTSQREGRNKKDYHRQETQFHGGEASYDEWAKAGKKGYK